jgi:signal transduction histidine kinase
VNDLSSPSPEQLSSPSRSVLSVEDATNEIQANQARELIAQALVHDLRSPLSAILSALNVIEDSLTAAQLNSLTHQALLTAQNSARRALGMVESLLDISRMESGKIELTLKLFHIQTLAAQALAEFRAQAQEFGIHLDNAIPQDFPMLRADQGKILRVLTNLIDNALKFTPSEGEVTLSASLSGEEWAVVQISDNGPGIAEEYREKIFDRFSPIPAQLGGRRRGSGLGLAFCRLAIEAHRGRIWVEPRAGGGSIFAFTLPLARPYAQTALTNF